MTERDGTDKALTWFFRIWVGLVLLLNFAGLAEITLTAETFWAGVEEIQDVYSPFNIWTHGFNLVLLLPAIGAYSWRDRRRRPRHDPRSKNPARREA